MSEENGNIKIIECPRDAMQGIHQFIPTEIKAAYINHLLDVGFDTIDFGSFVSEKAIPQMRDTAAVLPLLKISSSTKLLSIVANFKGAEIACQLDEISFLGYPFSISEQFQLNNTNSTRENSLKTIQQIQSLVLQSKKKLVVYISMAFGNPYGEEWNSDIAAFWITKIAGMGIEIMALSDTVGVAEAEDVSSIFGTMSKEFPAIEFGVHLHCRPDNWRNKTEAAYRSGCRRFDAAINGYGGCPMANDSLVGNLATENLIQFLDEKNCVTGIDRIRFNKAVDYAATVFNGAL